MAPGHGPWAWPVGMAANYVAQRSPDGKGRCLRRDPEKMNAFDVLYVVVVGELLATAIMDERARW